MKKKFIGVIGIVIAVIVGGIYYLTREEKIELSLKNKKNTDRISVSNFYWQFLLIALINNF